MFLCNVLKPVFLTCIFTYCFSARTCFKLFVHLSSIVKKHIYCVQIVHLRKEGAASIKDGGQHQTFSQYETVAFDRFCSSSVSDVISSEACEVVENMEILSNTVFCCFCALVSFMQISLYTKSFNLQLKLCSPY